MLNAQLTGTTGASNTQLDTESAAADAIAALGQSLLLFLLSDENLSEISVLVVSDKFEAMFCALCSCLSVSLLLYSFSRLKGRLTCMSECKAMQCNARHPAR